MWNGAYYPSIGFRVNAALAFAKFAQPAVVSVGGFRSAPVVRSSRLPAPRFVRPLQEALRGRSRL